MSEQEQQVPVGMVDTWTKFVQTDLPKEIERIRRKPMDAEQLQVELHATVMHALVQIGDWLVQMRDDIYERMAEHDVELETLNDRIEDADGSGSDTQLTPEDADAIDKLSKACKMFAEESLKATKDPTAVSRLQELVAIADYCSTLASEKVIEVEGEDEDEAVDEPATSVVVDGVAQVGGANG